MSRLLSTLASIAENSSNRGLLRIRMPSINLTKALSLCALTLVVSLQGCVTGEAFQQSELEQNNMPTEGKWQLLVRMEEADVAYSNQRWSVAVTSYQSLLSELPDDPVLWFRLGNSLTRQNKYSQAIHAYETSLRKDAGQIKPWFNLSTAHLLGAQLATLKAWTTMAAHDPTRDVVEQRLLALNSLLQ